MLLQGVDRYQVIEPLFEGVRVVLAYRGEPYTPAYIQGISGAAFRIGGICPCAPTCSTAMWTPDLVSLLGYTTTAVTLKTCDEDGDPLTRLQEMVALVHDEVRSGRPVLVWHAFTNAEWDVVCGFDAPARRFFGRGSYAGMGDYASADEGRAATAIEICPAYGALAIGEKTGAFDARSAELVALREAVRHARDQKGVDRLGGDGWVMLEGLACYDRWVREWRDDPQKKRGVGDSYCLGIYSSTHRAAAGFLREIAPRYAAASAHLASAAGHFAAEADALDCCKPLLWWDAPEGPDADRNRRAGELLSRARDSYARAIDDVEAAVDAMERDAAPTAQV